MNDNLWGSGAFTVSSHCGFSGISSCDGTCPTSSGGGGDGSGWLA